MAQQEKKVIPDDLRIIRSQRKSIGIEILPDGRILVRAPQRTSMKEIRRVLALKQGWIEKHLEAVRAIPAAKPLTSTELRELADRARKLIPERVAYYAPLVGVTYGRITIRKQKTRWGSCSAKGNLNFNCLLMLTPPEVIDSVVVHELCHRLEMNHSERFYREVERVFPEYRKWNAWLKTKGPAIMQKNT